MSKNYKDGNIINIHLNNIDPNDEINNLVDTKPEDQSFDEINDIPLR